jgi:CheY-like chemotaxis protein
MCPETVLVADDNPNLADLLTRDILPNLGRSTQRARDGQGASTSIAQQSPDLLLLDFSCPTLYDETRRRAQQALIYAHELNAAHKSEQHQRQALDRLRSNFLNALGHELKTPPAAILFSGEHFHHLTAIAGC